MRLAKPIAATCAPTAGLPSGPKTRPDTLAPRSDDDVTVFALAFCDDRMDDFLFSVGFLIPGGEFSVSRTSPRSSDWPDLTMIDFSSRPEIFGIRPVSGVMLLKSNAIRRYSTPGTR